MTCNVTINCGCDGYEVVTAELPFTSPPTEVQLDAPEGKFVVSAWWDEVPPNPSFLPRFMDMGYPSDWRLLVDSDNRITGGIFKSDISGSDNDLKVAIVCV